MNLILNLSVNLIGILIFLFMFWKRLKEDFSSEIIFKIGTSILFGIIIGVLISFYFLKTYFLWLALVGGLVGLTASILRQKIKFHETFEAFVIASLPWLSLTFFQDSITHSSLSSFLGFLGILFIVFISYYLDSHYKEFSWFKSGKIGFVGLTTLGLIFLVRFTLALVGVSMLSLVRIFDPYFSATGFVICLFLLARLSNSKE